MVKKMNEDKEKARIADTRNRIFQRIMLGLNKLKQRRNLLFMLIPIAFAIALILISYSNCNGDTGFDRLVLKADIIASILFAVLITLVILYFLGIPKGTTKIENGLLEAGINNQLGKTMMLTDKQYDEDSGMTKLIFNPKGIPIETLQDKTSEIEQALNVGLYDMEIGKNRRELILKTVSLDNKLKPFIPYSNEYMLKDETKFVLGESIYGQEIWDVNIKTHGCIGGSTGSGKSLLEKLIMIQGINKGYKVILYDFKGGVDFPPPWEKYIELNFDYDSTIKSLSALVDEMNYRKNLFKEVGCSNIKEYNNTHDDRLKRYLICIDEIAEMLDKTGLDKQTKEKVTTIEGYLSTLARLSRSFGFTLLVCTQRPDATILSGQIKNNLDFRACGRADNVLSQIILDNTDASKKISKQARGRFLTDEGRIFQAYLVYKDISNYITNDYVE